jgi:hypothetical protein
MNDKLIIVDFDGDEFSGIYRVYPANDESEPDLEFQSEFVYGNEDGAYEKKALARMAATMTAKVLAASIGGNWATNE